MIDFMTYRILHYMGKKLVCPKCSSTEIKKKVRKVNVNQSFECKDCHQAINIARFIEIFRCKKCKFKWNNTVLQ
jgi:transposase-like protein